MLGASNKDIASFAGVDRSGISRIKSGSRIPKPSSISTVKLIDGIFLFADDKNEMKKLILAVSCPGENPSPDEIKQYILQYLYEGYREQPVKTKAPKPKKKDKSVSFRSYGTKLDAVMSVADLSNMHLARMLHIDASAVSRYRNGLRTPKSNPKLTNEICDVLFARILELNRLNELLTLAKIPLDLADDEEECRSRFRNWLCDFETEGTSVLAEKLLDSISSFSADIKLPLPSFAEAAPDQILSDKKSVYFGIDGIRCAVIRFLGNAIQNHAKELWLYSDEDMGWMTDDMNFRLIWTSLMRECIRSGTKIRIIHNINRDLDEMIDAINSWIPLYVSGMIEPFYFKKQIESKFSTTIFLCPGLACISSAHVAGSEDTCIYRYDTDEKLLEIYKTDYKKLLGMSKPLVRIYREPEEEKKIYSGVAGVTAIGNTLSLATMPESVIKSVIERNELGEETKGEILSEWNSKTRLFHQVLKNGFVHECIKPAEEELLFGGKVPVDVRGASFTYTPQEYKEHIKNIIALSENHSNYRFYVLPDAAFTNINVVVSENSVMVTRLLSPKITIVFSHPAMCEAFWGYADHLKEQYKQDRITVRRQLERYV